MTKEQKQSRKEIALAAWEETARELVAAGVDKHFLIEFAENAMRVFKRTRDGLTFSIQLFMEFKNSDFLKIKQDHYETGALAHELLTPILTRLQHTHDGEAKIKKSNGKWSLPAYLRDEVEGYRTNLAARNKAVKSSPG